MRVAASTSSPLVSPTSGLSTAPAKWRSPVSRSAPATRAYSWARCSGLRVPRENVAEGQAADDLVLLIDEGDRFPGLQRGRGRLGDGEGERGWSRRRACRRGG